MAQRSKKSRELQDPLDRLRAIKKTIPSTAMAHASPPAAADSESTRYRDLSDVAVSLTSSLDLKAILDAIVDGIIRVSGCERGFVILREKDDNFAVFTGRSREGTPWEKSSAREISHTVVQRVVETYEPYIAGDVAQVDDLREQRSIVTEKIRSVVALPLIDKEQLIGVIYADSGFVIAAFGESDRSVLRAFGAQAAVAIARAREHGETIDRGEQLEEQNRQLRQQLGQHLHVSGMVIRNQRMLDLFTMVERLASSDMSSVLIRGESGTGKELIAHAIHQKSPRRGGPFVAVNVAAIVPTLVESTLFGYCKGAFTGAINDKPGYFEVADGGTLFLDEIGEMTPDIQAKLLRVLQLKEIERVGEAGKVRKVDVNVVAATNKDMARAVREGGFREDLYYRLNTADLYVPPLRERREDVLPLAEYFLKRLADDKQQVVPRLSRDARALLLEYRWPGNVRELENMMEWAFVFQDANGVITADPLERKIHGGAPAPVEATGDGSLRELIDRYEERLVREALERNDNNVSATARVLGLSRQMLHEKIKKYGIVTREP